MRIVCLTITTLTGLAFTGACARPASRSEPTADSTISIAATAADSVVRQTIARIAREFANHARSRSADSAAAWFAPDAIVLVNGAPPVKGRDAIREFYDQFFQAMPIRDMTFTTEEVTVSGDIAIETGSSSLVVGGPGQVTPVTVAGKYLAVWKRQPDGRWLLWRHSPSSNVMQAR
jgi:uncharacterized protein (TIGR02246 family)